MIINSVREFGLRGDLLHKHSGKQSEDLFCYGTPLTYQGVLFNVLASQYCLYFLHLFQ